MRKSATGFSYPCRLITLLLILLYIVDAAPASTNFQPDLGINKSTVENPDLEPTVLRKYYLLSRCSNMYVRIKPGTKRNSIDASGKRQSPYISIIMESTGPKGKVRLKGEKSKTYLCFSRRGKLKTEHHPIDRCNLIYNETHERYTQFRLEENESWFVGFKRKRLKNSRIKGKALPGFKKTTKKFARCYDFTLIPVHPIKIKKPVSPIDFNIYSPSYEPGEPFHKIRHMKKYEDLHRKMQGRRKHKNRRKSRRKQPGR